MLFKLQVAYERGTFRGVRLYRSRNAERRRCHHVTDWDKWMFKRTWSELLRMNRWP